MQLPIGEDGAMNASKGESVGEARAGATLRTPPLPMPRGLIFASSMWLIGSWLIALGLRSPVQPSAASYTPGVRVMLLCTMIGLMIAWPLYRLSQRHSRWPIQQTMLDLTVLLSLMQVVVWPLRLVTPWSALRTLAIDLTMIGWALLAGAAVASAIGGARGGPRSLAMIACLALCLLGPLLAWVGVMAGGNWMELVELSPLMAVQTLTGEGSARVTEAAWRWIALLGVASVSAWIVLLMAMAFRNRVESD